MSWEWEQQEKGIEGLSDWRVVAAYQHQRWQRNTTTARVRVKHRIAAMMERENNSCRTSICSHESSDGRGVIEFKVHRRVGGGNILLFLLEIIAPHLLPWFTFPLFPPLCVPEGNDTMGTFSIWHHEKDTTLAIEKMTEKTRCCFVLFNRCPGAFYHFIVA